MLKYVVRESYDVIPSDFFVEKTMVLMTRNEVQSCTT